MNTRKTMLFMLTLLVLITTLTVISATENIDSVSATQQTSQLQSTETPDVSTTAQQSTSTHESTSNSQSNVQQTSSTEVTKTTSKDTSQKTVKSTDSQDTVKSTSDDTTTTSQDTSKTSTSKVDSGNSNINTTSSLASSDNNIQNTSTEISSNKTLKTAYTHIVDNDTVSDIFDRNGLSELVSDGDTLDFQGLITVDQDLTVDKSVNIISSTSDCNISLNGRAFTLAHGASYSNVTGINFYNTQFYVKNATEIVIDNITAVVEDKEVGSGEGQTSIREDSSYITIKNSYFHTKDNYGHSTVVFAWASNCVVDNCTIIGEGNVGNLFYITTYNTAVPDQATANMNITLTNSYLSNPTGSTAISVPIVLTGKNHYIANNTINCTGHGLMAQNAYFYPHDGTVFENNIWTEDDCYLTAISNATFINNTFSSISTNGVGITITGNTMNSATISNDYNNFTKNTVNGVLYVSGGYNNIVENTIINDDQYTIQLSGSNNNVTDNHLETSEKLADESINNTGSNNTLARNGPTSNTRFSVTNFIELEDALETIKISSDNQFTITLEDTGDTTAFEVRYLLNLTSTTTQKSIVINSNNLSINGIGSQQFLAIGSGYTVEFRNITIENCFVSESGAALYNEGNLIISNSQFINNYAEEYGGAIYNNGTLTITNTEFSKNKAKYGSAIATIYANTSISNSLFTNNTADDCGGAIYVNGVGNQYITNTNFTENSAINGAAIYLYQNGNMQIEDSIFANNTATENGAAIYSYNYDITLENSNFTTNTATNGGAIYSSGSSVITDSQFIENNATSTADAIYNTGKLTLTNSQIQNSMETETIKQTIITSPVYDTSLSTTETITFTIGSDKVTTTIDNGVVSIEYMFATNGQKQAVISYPSYDSTVITITIIVEGETTLTFTIDSIESAHVDDTVELTAHVTAGDTGINEGQVVFKVNGKSVRDSNGNPIYVDVVDGIAKVNYTIPETISDTYVISGVYTGSKNFVSLRTDTNGTITVVTKTASISIETSGELIAANTITIKATITNTDGSLVTTGRVVFKLNGVSLKDSNGNVIYVDVEDGIATLNYTIPSNYSAKDYTLTAVFQATGYERTETNTSITIKKLDTTIKIDDSILTSKSNDTITITQGENLQLKATIIDETTKTAVTGTTKVAVKLNNKTVIQTYVTDGVIDLTLYTSSFKNPTYTIEVIAGENSQYSKSLFNGTLNVLEPNSLLINETSDNGTTHLVKEY